jgi:lysophospholipase L1-like esterase
VDYSVLGDSISTGYDANGSLLSFGMQPYYSYGVGWNTTVFSIWKRLEAIYGPNSVTPHLMAVPGDTASDLVWQSLYAVQNHSGLVSLLIGGNDACSSTNSNPTPTPVWNFSQSLNRTFTILRDNLPPSTVITLGNVVNVSQLGSLFAGNLQAELVYSQTCPILNDVIGGNTTAANQLSYMISAYNKVEEQIDKVYNVIPWDINSFAFTSNDVNTLDYFHPSVTGQGLLASMWWSQLPYAAMFPRLSDPSYRASVPEGTPLNVSAFAWDIIPATVSVTYEGPGMSSWTTANLSLQSGLDYNGTFGLTLPANATASPGTLRFFLTANDTDGYGSTLPYSAPATFYTVRITSTTSPVISSFSAYPNPVVANQPTSLNVSASAGNPPFTYAYVGLPPGCHSTNSSVVSCTPTAAGNYTVYVYVNDSVGLSAVPAYVLLTVTREVTLSVVTLVPATTTLSSTGSQVFVAQPGCTGGVCPSGATFTWALTSGLADLSATSGQSVTVTAGATAGELALYANGTLDGVTVMSSPATIVITPQSTPVLTAVNLSPGSAMVQIDNSMGFTATPVCGTSSCDGTVSYSWTLTGVTGNLSSPAGASTTFTAGSAAGTTTLTVTARLNGIAASASAQITVTTSAVPVLLSVSISPISVSVQTETSEGFTASAVCSPTPCLTSPTYSWTLGSTLGNLTQYTGASTYFVAGNTAGTVSITVTATLNGKQVQNSSTIVITQPASGTTGTLSGGDLILIAIIVAVAAIAVVAVLLMRRTHKGAGQQSPIPPWPGSPGQ